MLEGIPVPPAVFEEVIGIFSTSALAAPKSVTITVDRAPWLEEADRDEPALGGQRREVELEGRPISWGYRPIDPRRRKVGTAGWGTLSMTSAEAHIAMPSVRAWARRSDSVDSVCCLWDHHAAPPSDSTNTDASSNPTIETTGSRRPSARFHTFDDVRLFIVRSGVPDAKRPPDISVRPSTR